MGSVRCPRWASNSRGHRPFLSVPFAIPLVQAGQWRPPEGAVRLDPAPSVNIRDHDVTTGVALLPLVLGVHTVVRIALGDESLLEEPVAPFADDQACDVHPVVSPTAGDDLPRMLRGPPRVAGSFRRREAGGLLRTMVVRASPVRGGLRFSSSTKCFVPLQRSAQSLRFSLPVMKSSTSFRRTPSSAGIRSFAIQSLSDTRPGGSDRTRREPRPSTPGPAPSRSRRGVGSCASCAGTGCSTRRRG